MSSGESNPDATSTSRGTERSGELVTETEPALTSPRRSLAPPERRSLDIGEVIVVVHLQNPSLKANRTQKQVELRLWRASVTCGGDAERAYPSVHRLLHLHGESPRSPVHHRVAELEEKRAEKLMLGH